MRAIHQVSRAQNRAGRSCRSERARRPRHGYCAREREAARAGQRRGVTRGESVPAPMRILASIPARDRPSLQCCFAAVNGEGADLSTPATARRPLGIGTPLHLLCRRRLSAAAQHWRGGDHGHRPPVERRAATATPARTRAIPGQARATASSGREVMRPMPTAAQADPTRPKARARIPYLTVGHHHHAQTASGVRPTLGRLGSPPERRRRCPGWTRSSEA